MHHTNRGTWEGDIPQSTRAALSRNIFWVAAHAFLHDGCLFQMLRMCLCFIVDEWLPSGTTRVIIRQRNKSSLKCWHTASVGSGCNQSWESKEPKTSRNAQTLCRSWIEWKLKASIKNKTKYNFTNAWVKLGGPSILDQNWWAVRPGPRSRANDLSIPFHVCKYYIKTE